MSFQRGDIYKWAFPIVSSTSKANKTYAQAWITWLSQFTFWFGPAHLRGLPGLLLFWPAPAENIFLCLWGIWEVQTPQHWTFCASCLLSIITVEAFVWLANWELSQKMVCQLAPDLSTSWAGPRKSTWSNGVGKKVDLPGQIDPKLRSQFKISNAQVAKKLRLSWNRPTAVLPTDFTSAGFGIDRQPYYRLTLHQLDFEYHFPL